MRLIMHTEEAGGTPVLRLQGGIDTIGAPLLEKQLTLLINEGKKKILLDFTSVDYLSSAGLRVLLSFTKKLRLSQGALVLYSVEEDVMEIIKLAGFDRLLEICKDEQDALKKVAK